MIFNKKDGTIRDNYIEVCDLILTAKPYTAEIMRGRSDDIVETYECYKINFPYDLSRRKGNDYELKVQTICRECGYKTRSWYSLKISSMHIMSKNIDDLINSIKSSKAKMQT